MATSLPVLDSTTHIASVTYACTFGLTTSDSGLVSFIVPQPVQFTFSFETGRTQPDPDQDIWDITTDYTWFDQDTVEAGIISALGTICTTIATLIGATPLEIEETVTIERTWRVNPDQVGTDAPVQIPDAPVVYAEQMQYPPGTLIQAAAFMGGSGSAGA